MPQTYCLLLPLNVFEYLYCCIGRLDEQNKRLEDVTWFCGQL